MIKKIRKTIISIVSLGVVSTPLLLAVSCGSPHAIINAVNNNWNHSYEKGAKSIERTDDTNYVLYGKSSGFGQDIILKDVSYNGFYDEVQTIPNSVGIAVIANHKVYTDIVNITEKETVIEALDSSRFHFERYMHQTMGAFINSVSIKGLTTNPIHGTRTAKNYGDYYPMYYINHVFAQLGVSNYHLAGHEVLELSYDDK